MSDNIEAIKNFELERFILVIHTQEGDIKIETTKAGAILLIKLLNLHTEVVKKGGDGFSIELLPKTDDTRDDDFILEQFKDREELISGAVLKAIAIDAANDPMYF